MEREYLLRVIRPFVIRAARRSAATFERPYLGFDDYLSIGYVAALKALDRFKPKKGLPPNEVKALWIGFASRHIRGAMASAMRETRRRTRHEDAFLPPAFMDDYRGGISSDGRSFFRGAHSGEDRGGTRLFANGSVVPMARHSP